ncbi:uncharacterized protein LOC132838467 [Tachysurus vachellii]|uniref:uncharacterized protein LOC132838467 n=1 Tax=Tachysurus vachellii TaxID=175792 RepID=UPI00296A9205|nr:uncharacterized protein LOC132838467 [Tachysurus vachellii]
MWYTPHTLHTLSIVLWSPCDWTQLRKMCGVDVDLDDEGVQDECEVEEVTHDAVHLLAPPPAECNGAVWGSRRGYGVCVLCGLLLVLWNAGVGVACVTLLFVVFMLVLTPPTLLLYTGFLCHTRNNLQDPNSLALKQLIPQRQPFWMSLRNYMLLDQPNCHLSLSSLTFQQRLIRSTTRLSYSPSGVLGFADQLGNGSLPTWKDAHIRSWLPPPLSAVTLTTTVAPPLSS